MITWPAVIKYDGDNELGYVASQDEWESGGSISEMHYRPEDQMIDSGGAVYQLTDRLNGKVIPKLKHQHIELEALTILVREHASALGNCCVSKLGFYSISEAIASVGELDEP